jgi:hypothetical protein
MQVGLVVEGSADDVAELDGGTAAARSRSDEKTATSGDIAPSALLDSDGGVEAA